MGICGEEGTLSYQVSICSIDFITKVKGLINSVTYRLWAIEREGVCVILK